MFQKYFGVVHMTGEIREYEAAFPLSAEGMLLALSLLNSSATTYGVTYYVENQLTMGEILKQEKNKTFSLH